MLITVILALAGLVCLALGLSYSSEPAGYDIVGGYGGRKPPGMQTSAYYTWRNHD